MLRRNPYYLLDPAFYLKEVSGAAELAPKSRFDYSRSLRKALSVPAKGVLFPANRLQEPDFPHFLKEMESNGLIPIVQIHASSGNDNRCQDSSPSLLHSAVERFFNSSIYPEGGAGPKEQRPDQPPQSSGSLPRGGGLQQGAPPGRCPSRGLNVIFHDPKILRLFLSEKNPDFSFERLPPLSGKKESDPVSSKQALGKKPSRPQASARGLKEAAPQSASADFCFFTFIVTRKGARLNLPELLPPSVLENTELYLPYKKSLYDPFLTPKEIYLYMKEGRFGAARPFTGDIQDDRIPQESCLEPIVRPYIASPACKSLSPPPDFDGFAGESADRKPAPQAVSNPKDKLKRSPVSMMNLNNDARYNHREAPLDFSIVIPSCNNKSRLICTLKQLTRLDFPKNRFEVIVADDGSSDGSFAALGRFIKDQKKTAFKAVRFPRVRPRTPGSDAPDFRAGIARNLGAKYAEGKRLAFLDSDILVPPDYLTVVKEEHEAGADLVQLKRYHLSRPLPSEFAGGDFLNELSEGDALYVKESAYWKPFYDKGFDGVSAPWKYVCSYGLSLSKKDFIEQGRFGRTFVYYGFEDTDLGYRMFKAGKKLKLSRIRCVHQFIPQSKREDGGAYKRRAFLSRTAKIFYLRHLDPLIFEELCSFMRQERGFLGYFLPFLRREKPPALF